MSENVQSPAAQNPSSTIQPQNDRSQQKWNMLRTREKDSPLGYTWIGLANSTGKHINVFAQDTNQAVIQPYDGDIVMTSQYGSLSDLTLYLDDNPYVTNPYPITFAEDTSGQAFSWNGVPSEFILYIQNLDVVPNYRDAGAVPPQSGYWPYGVDQFGVRWCTLIFTNLSDWNQ
jgi:hypothetical protein